MSYVTVKNINKQFQQKSVLKNVSFTIEKGERFGLIGPNGAGKSTLIDIMTGLTAAESGEVMVDGVDIKKDILAIRKKLGVVPQDIALMEELTGYDNLIYFGGMYGLSGAILKTRVNELLTTIGLTAHAKKKVKTYSGGMKRRLNIAAALLHHPEFLILDEPTVGVDPQSRQYIFDFLKQLNEAGTTILYISHYMEEIEALCERLLILDLGSEVAYGTKAEVKSLVRQSSKVTITLDYVSDEVLTAIEALDNGISEVTRDFNNITLLVDSSVFSMMRLIQALEATDSVIKSLSLEDISLEETFLQLTGKSLRE
ncbi:ABC transporter ATP-binding protein [Tuanshanicoccus lijuaniae]|uniref:ABC transporter ATP-binding protein n=1 Tax=Aerococcaceae bacterium zg-1292 TaxID=2774330 RepID=UPI001BD8829C|nr:ABC transporter ATP-binding protein [Aerococcaceae bacterium zg-BR9]MBS4456169.1 ABC transporter ATP-binding protein [Aerococcaceae bacterium zg-A91]MBS4458020.1 ABC transporter ATP-binding protein [Aerococcaceae bacterium zg-BR33]